MRASHTSGNRRAGPRDRRSQASVRRRDDYEHTLAILDSAHEAFVSMDEKGLIRGWNQMAERTFGWTREEAIGRDLADLIVPARVHEQHRSGLERFLETGEGTMLGRRVEAVAMRRDGSEIPVELTISVTRSLGSVAFHAFVRDISERRRSEQYMRAQLAVSRALADGPTLEQAWPAVLGALAGSMSWAVGLAWIVDGSVLRCQHAWSAPGEEDVAFQQASLATAIAPGVGLPGRAWESCEAAWIEDVQEDARDARGPAAARAGLRGGLALPVVGAGEVLAVLEFLDTTTRPPDEPLRETLRTVGEQVGQFALRRRVEMRLARTEERLQDLVESTAFVSKLLDNTQALIFVKDRQGRYLVANRALEELLGGRSPLGATDHEILPSATADLVRARDLEVLDGGRSLEFEDAVELDGEERTLLVVRFPLLDADDRPFAVGGIATDITRRKQAERAAEHARVAAVRADREKSELLSRMSHELRTPLNAILGFGQLLEMDLEGDAREDVRRILEAGRRLLELVDDVLQISRGESPGDGPEPRPAELAPIVDDAIAPTRNLAGERGVVLHVDPSVAVVGPVMAIHGALTDALAELVSNAVRFSPEGGVVALSADSAGGRVRIQVRDQGPGIAPADVDRAFVPFERLGPVPDGNLGKGLGLTRAKRLVASMGGEVGCESAPGSGATFWVDLRPADEGAGAAPDPQQAPAGPSSNGTRTLLYIDDSPSNLRIVEQTLEQRPAVSLLTAATGSEGLELATRERPDLVLLDLNLPDMRGEDVLAGLTGAEATGDIPVIMLSADASEATAARLLAAGAADYLTKPFDLADFLEIVDARLSTGRHA